jgi:hypothetical protein
MGDRIFGPASVLRWRRYLQAAVAWIRVRVKASWTEGTGRMPLTRPEDVRVLVKGALKAGRDWLAILSKFETASRNLMLTDPEGLSLLGEFLVRRKARSEEILEELRKAVSELIQDPGPSLPLPVEAWVFLLSNEFDGETEVDDIRSLFANVRAHPDSPFTLFAGVVLLRGLGDGTTPKGGLKCPERADLLVEMHTILASASGSSPPSWPWPPELASRLMETMVTCPEEIGEPLLPRLEEALVELRELPGISTKRRKDSLGILRRRWRYMRMLLGGEVVDERVRAALAIKI